MSGYYGPHPGYVEVDCDEHGKFLVSQRRADGEGGGWREVRCPVCKAEEDREPKPQETK